MQVYLVAIIICTTRWKQERTIIYTHQQPTSSHMGHLMYQAISTILVDWLVWWVSVVWASQPADRYIITGCRSFVFGSTKIFSTVPSSGSLLISLGRSKAKQPGVRSSHGRMQKVGVAAPCACSYSDPCPPRAPGYVCMHAWSSKLKQNNPPSPNQ